MNKEQITTAIKTKVAEIWHADQHSYDHGNIKVEIVTTSNKETAVEIQITRMYSAPGLKFSQLQKLSEYFKGTTRIEIISDIASEGCETCDYGSCYGFVLLVLPPTKDQKPMTKENFWWAQA